MRSALAKQSGSTGGVIVMFRVSLVTALLAVHVQMQTFCLDPLQNTKDFNLRQEM